MMYQLYMLLFPPALRPLVMFPLLSRSHCVFGSPQVLPLRNAPTHTRAHTHTHIHINIIKFRAGRLCCASVPLNLPTN